MRENLIREKHCGTLGGHFGIDRTLELLRRNYHWPKLPTDVRNFVETCTICQRAKGVRTNQGHYQPLTIPTNPSNNVSIDFVLGLPRTRQVFDSTFVIVDKFSKMAHFVPRKISNDASHIANLFFKEVVKIHGLSTSIILDRDMKFQGHFWRTLWKKLYTNLSFSSAYHAQIDG